MGDKNIFLGLSAMDLATFLAAVATFSVILAIYAAITVRDPMSRRVKSLQIRREQLRADLTVRKRASLTRTSRNTELMRTVLTRLSALQDEQMKDARRKLAQAGIRSKDAAVAVIFGRLALPIILGGTTCLGVFVLGWFPEWVTWKRAALACVSLILGYKAPDLFVKNLITKRADAIRKGLPDALDLMVICAEAGLTVDAAFGRVARELGKGFPEVGDEFALTAIELTFLSERRQAFENLAARCNSDAIRGVATTMIQTEKYGTPLASALRTLSAEFRNDRMLRAEEKAARLPAIMTVPLILFILPTLFIVIMGPAACSIADNLGGSMGGK